MERPATPTPTPSRSSKYPWPIPSPPALPNLVHMYDDLITQNASAVSQIETALRSLTYLIPGRFRESELASESLHSGVQLLSLYHDAVLARRAHTTTTATTPVPASTTHLPSPGGDHSPRHASRAPPPPPPPPPTTPHNRYARHWTRASPVYRRVATSLQVVQYTELLLEMYARRRGGDRARWRVVVAIEVIKAVGRLLLLRFTQSRPLLTRPLPEREIVVDHEQADAHHDDDDDDDHDLKPAPPWTMPRTGRPLPTALPLPDEVTPYLLAHVLSPDDVKPAPALLHRLTSGTGQLAEWLYILRPVVYAVVLQRLARQAERRRGPDWRPWLLGLGLEYAARQLAKADFRAHVAGGLRALTALEREEWRRRGWSLAWWALRGACYEQVTRPYLHRFAAGLRHVPVLGLVGGVLEDYEYLWDRYYFSTATL
ncbi:MAG: Peroxisomal membrane protein pex16 [Phylliscum demangeonii]|nr:MAG: Peroxisomal membrane protein pex16 [Phylliscum demangeonii]